MRVGICTDLAQPAGRRSFLVQCASEGPMRVIAQGHFFQCKALKKFRVINDGTGFEDGYWTVESAIRKVWVLALAKPVDAGRSN